MLISLYKNAKNGVLLTSLEPISVYSHLNVSNIVGSANNKPEI